MRTRGIIGFTLPLTPPGRLPGKRENRSVASGPEGVAYWLGWGQNALSSSPALSPLRGGEGDSGRGCKDTIKLRASFGVYAHLRSWWWWRSSGCWRRSGCRRSSRRCRRKGMRKAISDITDACASARAKAIFSGQRGGGRWCSIRATIPFSVEAGRRGKRRVMRPGAQVVVASSKLPDDVDFAMLDINQQGFRGASEWAKVWFFPNGTKATTMTIVLHDRTSIGKKSRWNFPRP